MTKLLIFFLIVPIFGLGQSKFNIKGHLKNSSGRKIYLTNRGLGFSDKLNEIRYDSTIAHNDEFLFNGQLDHFAYYGIRVEGENDWKAFIIDTTIFLNGKVLNIWDSTLVYSTQNNWKKIGTRGTDSIAKVRESLQDSLFFYENKKDQSRVKKIVKSMDSLDLSLANFISAFVKQYPTSYYALMLLKENYTLNANIEDSARKVFKLLDSSRRNSKEGVQLAYTLFSLKDSIKIGNPAINVNVIDTKKNNKKLEIRKDEITIIDFWASWCIPCIAKIPELKRINNTHRDLRIISISLDEKYENWKKAVELHKIIWENFGDLEGFNGTMANKYGIRFIPYIIVFGKDAKISLLNPSLKVIQSYLKAALK